MKRKLWMTAVVVGFLVGGCGGDDDTELAGPADTVDVPAVSGDETAVDLAEDLTEGVEELTENLEDLQASQGGGSATLTVGDQSWTFAPVLCAFGEEQIGQEGAVFNLSSIQDGMQMYASVDVYGHSVTLDDIRDFENPSVSLSSTGDGFLSIDGKTITGSAEFRDGTTDDFSTVAGEFSASCP